MNRQTSIEQLRASLKPANQGPQKQHNVTVVHLQVHGREIPCTFVGNPSEEHVKKTREAIIRIHHEGINHG